MTKSTRLNDLQLILLSHAAKHNGGSMFPLPDAALSDPARTEIELKSLLRRELVAQTPAVNAASTWRFEGDQNFGLIMTPKGGAAIDGPWRAHSGSARQGKGSSIPSPE